MPANLARWFPELSRVRGEVLARQRAVELRTVTPHLASADVQGTYAYAVRITVEGQTATLGCSCPHAGEGACCKHIWATLVRIDGTPAYASLAAALRQATRVRQEFLVGAPGDAGEHAGADAAESSVDRNADDAPHPFFGHRVPPGRPDIPHWQVVLDRAAFFMANGADDPLAPAPRRTPRTEWPADRRIVYVLDPSDEATRQSLRLEVMTEKRERDGSWGPPRKFAYASDVWAAVPDARDRAIRRLLLGVAPPPDDGHARTGFSIAESAYGLVLPLVGATGRLRLKIVGPRDAPLLPVAWDEKAGTADSTLVPWRFALAIDRAAPDAADWVLAGALERGDERRPLTDVRWMHESGLCVLDAQLAPVALGDQWPLIADLLHERALVLGTDVAPALERLYALPRVPELVLPAELAVRTSHAAPQPGVRFVPDPTPWAGRYGGPVLGVQLAFRYGGAAVNAGEPGDTRFDAGSRTVHHRDRDAEKSARDRLLAFGGALTRNTSGRGVPFLIARSQVRRAAEQLASEGWWVEADGRTFRLPGTVQARVRSGADWFDLEGTVTYGDTSVSLADVLAAKRRGADVVELADGSMGALPNEWLDRLGPVFAGGESTTNGARFARTQLALLDALLATLPDVDVDAAYEQAREALTAFARITPADPPPSFTGILRPYQRDGLGWLHFLRDFGFGGCLADDMGLGKTIQVLALLDTRRSEGHGPSLVVVPRSLVYNWRAEAERFAPSLRVADWSGAARDDHDMVPRDVDMVLATYGTLRRDAAMLAEIPFDYVVLDEAQAIKNRGTATAKACRLLQASHRLALSGTPVENRLDELWSLLDFLNPGMLGTSSRFAASLRAAGNDRVVDAVLSQALRPVILRRTKAAVAPELPPRLEGTLEVELEPRQRAFYDQVHKRVRRDVLQQVEEKGLARSRLQVLEGLLRLRQAACHPVLADPRKGALPSAKLDALVPALADVVAEGHKALVFSQFTSFLALVRQALDAEGITYEYLDGRTKDRQARVDRFQGDPACPVFLVSLKAGGHGLNLTAADYVYLLDPWWNPAVEAQAIDRAHRIGRTRRVIATRLVAKGTIEEKILALQASKQALADAILSADRGGLASIGREELELLLG
jgi:superfamily II DNA or RNA helicase